MARILRVVAAIGAVTRLFSIAFLAPALFALFYDARDVAVGGTMVPRGALMFAAAAAATFLLGTFMVRGAGRAAEHALRDRDAYLTVGIGWLWLCSLAMAPFMLEGVLLHPIDAFFEAMSGMTTTGATVMGDQLESAPKSLMLWRALLQFIGGMGIIVLSIAVLGRLTQGGTQLLQAEAPGPSVERISPRIARTAALLWTVYLSMAAVLFVTVMLVLLPHGFGLKQTIYEALILTFTTISTGGFGAHPESIAYFHDGLLETVLVIFMLASGTNYTLHYRAARGDLRAFWRDEEWRFYMGTFLVITLMVTGALARAGAGTLQAARSAAFTVASLITSTGFTTADFDLWPTVTKALVLLLMVTGATAGSTGGGIKHIRVLLMFKIIRLQLQRFAHPSMANQVRLGLRTIQTPTLMRASAFIVAFVAMWMAGTMLLVMFDPAFSHVEDATSASVSALSNMGPGLGVAGPSHDFADVSPFSKVVLAMEMWFGRLEIFAALLVFTPETWRH